MSAIPAFDDIEYHYERCQECYGQSCTLGCGTLLLKSRGVQVADHVMCTARSCSNYRRVAAMGARLCNAEWHDMCHTPVEEIMARILRVERERQADELVKPPLPRILLEPHRRALLRRRG